MGQRQKYPSVHGPGGCYKECSIEKKVDDRSGIIGDQSAFLSYPEGDNSNEEDLYDVIEYPGTYDVVPHFGFDKAEFVEYGDDHRFGGRHTCKSDDKGDDPVVPQVAHHSHTQYEGYGRIEYGGEKDVPALGTHLLHIDLQSDEKKQKEYAQLGQYGKYIVEGPMRKQVTDRGVVCSHGDKKCCQNTGDLQPFHEAGQNIGHSEQQSQQQQELAEQLIVHGFSQTMK